MLNAYPCVRFIFSGGEKAKNCKKILKLRFLDNFSKAEAEECDQKD